MEWWNPRAPDIYYWGKWLAVRSADDGEGRHVGDARARSADGAFFFLGPTATTEAAARSFSQVSCGWCKAGSLFLLLTPRHISDEFLMMLSIRFLALVAFLPLVSTYVAQPKTVLSAPRPAARLVTPLIPSAALRHPAPRAAQLPAPLTTGAKTVASVASIVSVDVLLRRYFTAKAIPFPSSLAGMLGLFGLLCTLQATVPAAASKINDAAAPGCAFISRWLALFFVPNLVLLPLVLTMSASEALRLLALIVGGVGVSLPLIALTANAALGSVPPSAPALAPPSAPAATNYLTAPPPAFLLASSTALGLAALATGGASVLVTNTFLASATITGFVLGGTLPKRTQKVLHPLIICSVLTQGLALLLATLTAQPVTPLLRYAISPDLPRSPHTSSPSMTFDGLL